MPQLTFQSIEEQLDHYPSLVRDQYRTARTELQGKLRENDLLDWASIGAEIAGKSVRAWEAAAEYFKASPEVQRQLPSGQFVRWAGIGSRLCSDSPNLAVAYFEASPASLIRLRPRYIEDWANLGRALYRGTWKSSTLACQFYKTTPAILEHLTFVEYTQFAQFLETVSLRSYDLAAQCLDDGPRLFSSLGQERQGVIAIGRALADRSWRDIRAFFDASFSALPKLDPVERGRLLTIVNRLVIAGQVSAGEAVSAGAVALLRVDPDRRARMLEIVDGLTSVSPGVSPELLKRVPGIMERVSFSQFEEWHRQGLAILNGNRDAGLSFYRLESARAQELLDALASGVELVRIRDLVRTYCRALVGQEIELGTTGNLVDKNIGWVEGDAPTTEGSTIYLPEVVDRFPSKDANFAWYKVVATHQVGHIEFGSFGFDFDRPSTKFDDLRPQTEGRDSGAEAVPEPVVEALPPDLAESLEKGGVETLWLTDMSRFFALFADRALAHDVFTVVEDARLDARIVYEYRGIESAYRVTQDHSLRERPQIEELPAREAMVEFIVRVSLEQREKLAVPHEYVDTARKIARIVDAVKAPTATVEDSAEATVRIYALLAGIPNNEVPEDDFEEIDLDEQDEEQQDQPYQDEDDSSFYLDALAGTGEGEASETGEESGDETGDEQQGYESPEDVSYRGDFKPELAQLLEQLRMGAGEGESSTEPITEEQLQELLEQSSEIEGEPSEGEEEGEGERREIPEEMIQNLLKEMAKRDPNDPQSSQGPFVHVDEDGGPLEPADDRSFIYDEWDFRGNEYKARWCMVHEKDMAEGDPGFYRETLGAYSSMVRDIHRQFELVSPEMYRKIKRLEDGEDHDFDAVVESFVDRRSGNQPSEKLFWRRNKVERDVAVAFLLDMSASTAEAIDESPRQGDDWGAPDDPVEYMVWLRSRRAEGLRRSYKRIVDIEKEGIVLLANALELLGDQYAIYGFSGYGRENVEFYVIKDLAERFSPAIPRRIDRIAPLHATRMGPAIRHATVKLLQQEARSKILFMITDGRPQDRGYSREGVEKEYAVHDTKQALMEARREGIMPFCLTVDKAGHDYMKTMMQDMSYEVLHDIRTLPKRLPQLYKKLTT